MTTPEPLQGKFSWKGIKAWAGSVRSGMRERTPGDGHGTTARQTPGGFAIDTAVLLTNQSVVGNNKISLQVCIGGVTKTVTFVIIDSPT
jgi:hypothetical protein